MKPLALAGSLACLAAACGTPAASTHAPDGGDAAASSGDGKVDVSSPDVPSPAGAWTWIDVPGSSCDEGTPTGIAVNPGSGTDVLVYFEGGGACWDYGTCFVLNTSLHGPFGRTQWNALATQVNLGPLDRTRATNPFRASSYVFIPYCTGDMHAGNNVQTYDGAAGPKTMHHVGRKNAEAALAVVTAMWKTPSRVVVAGSSAGGFGATFNYDLFRRAYPDADMALVDDAGPLLEGGGIPADIRANAYMYWHLGDAVDPLCAACRDDFSGVTAALATRYPNDRLALISALTDPTVSLFFRLSLDQFQASLLATVAHRYTPTTNARAFLVTGTQHTYLATQATTTSKGVTLESWLSAMLGGGAWDTVKP
jgi:Pectinacetylesterase